MSGRGDRNYIETNTINLIINFKFCIMKRLFSNLKTIAMGTVMVALMGAVTLNVGCSTYDDTDVINRINEVEKDIAALKERVSALESRLTTELEALNELVNGLNVVTGVTTENGNTIVALADGTTFTVYAQCNVVDTDTDTDTYLSVREDGGVYYWALFDKDGFKEWLLVNGEKVAVYQEVEGCACDLQCKVDETTGNLLISIDGGSNYVDTGICLTNDEGEETVGACVFTGVSVDEENGTVTFTTPDGEFTVALAEVIEFSVKDTLYVAAGKSKTVTFEAGEAVSDVYVMNQPLGWSAAVEGNTLTVTAPAKAIYEMGAAEKAGVVALHLNTASGACKVAKLDVSYAELTLNVDKAGNITVKNTLVETFNTTNEYWQPIEVTDFVMWQFVVMPLDDYTGDIEESMMNSRNYVTANDENLAWIDGVSYERLPYEEGVVEELVCTTTAEALIYGLTYGDMPYEGESFLIAVIPYNMNNYSPDYANAVVAEFKQLKVAASVAYASWNTVYFNVVMRGAESYYVNYVEAAEIANYSEPAEYYAEQLAMFSEMGQFGYLSLTEDYVNSYIAFNEFMNYGAEYPMDFSLTPGTAYQLAILPVVEGKEEYTYEDLILLDFATEPIVAAETPAEITMTADIDYAFIKPTVVVPETTAVVYYGWADEVAETDEQKADVINTLMNGYYKVNDFEEYGYTISHGGDRYLSNWNLTYNLKPGQTKIMQVLVVDTDGKYTLKQEAFKTKEIVVNETYTLGVGELSFSGGVLSVPVTGMDGASIAKYRYYMVDTSYYSLKDAETISGEIAISTHSHYVDITGEDITNPLLIKSGLKGYSYKALAAGTTYRFALIAMFADGSISNVVVVDELTYDMEMVKATDPTYEAMKPAIAVSNIVYDAEFESWYIDYTFTMPEGVEEVYASVFDPEFIANQAGRSAKISYVVDNCSYTETKGVYTEQYVGFSHYNIYYTWKDSEGKMYEVATYELAAELEAAANPGGGEEAFVGVDLTGLSYVTDYGNCQVWQFKGDGYQFNIGFPYAQATDSSIAVGEYTFDTYANFSSEFSWGFPTGSARFEGSLIYGPTGTKLTVTEDAGTYTIIFDVNGTNFRYVGAF